ncbi:ADP-ribosylation factor-like protein 15 [Drosophila grimshawi]|uniref:GH17972 n=1 Tax=Drosophila grimshawi TaxID=7222 RepID=B4JXK2_DROGR|nr:ADP-ribosylation factor-like protein 15 [Drosophila grimshawi]EDV95478.1 GH17972 [Drosophila grimshawi]
MGLRCAKLRRCSWCASSCSCSWCCCCCSEPAATERFKVLLLGAAGSGKTQLGHLLSGEERDAADLGPTNGVRCYRCQPDAGCLLLLTEVGGSEDMQRIWPHYYASCHALIFCYELSDSYEELLVSFRLLQRCLEHRELRGKPVLLVAWRNCDGIQLYDVAHAFRLEQLANECGCPLHMCHLGHQRDVWHGLAWLQRQLHDRAPALAQRIKYDLNMQSWQRRKRTLLSNGKLAQVHRQRFRRAHRKLWPLTLVSDVTQPSPLRPRTAPAAIFTARTQQP